MDIVIIGSGEVGHHLAEVLSKGEHRVSVIDADRERIRELQESLDVQAVEGDATVAEHLTRAGVPKCDLVVAATDNDLVNIRKRLHQLGLTQTVEPLTQLLCQSPNSSCPKFNTLCQTPNILRQARELQN